MTLSKKKQVQAADDDNVYHIDRKKESARPAYSFSYDEQNL